MKSYKEMWDAELIKLGNPTIRELREKVGASRQEVADKLLIPIKTLIKWEVEERQPPIYVERFIIKELLKWKRGKKSI